MQEAICEEIIHTRGTPEFHQDKRRRIPGEPRKSFEATQMWDLYQEIARRVVLGQKNVEIANDLGITPATVSYVRNSPLIQERINNLQAQANGEVVSISRRIKDLAPQALDLLEAIIVKGKVGAETIPAKLRADHAERLLDRAGHVPPKEIRTTNLHGHYTVDDIERLKARALSGAESIIAEAEVVND